MLNPFSHPLPLRIIVIVPFAIQIAATVGITGWLSYQNGQKAVGNTASELLVQAKYRIRERLDRILTQAETIAQVNAFAYQQGQISLDRELALQAYFWQQMQHNKPTPQGVYVGDIQGRYLYVGYVGLKNRPLVVEKAVSQKLAVYSLDPQGKRQQQIDRDDYDPRKRPWYQEAIGQNNPVWTKIYTFTSGELGITLAQAIRNPAGQIQGVAAIDLGLEDLDTYLQTTQFSRSSQLFIIEPSGLLVAASSRQPTVKLGDGVNKQLKQISAIDSHEPVIRESAAYLKQKFGGFDRIDEPLKVEVTLQKERHFLSVVPYEFGQNRKWLVVTVVPERDFTEQIDNNRRYTLILCFVSLFLAIAVGSLTSRLLTKTILRLAQATEEIKEGKWEQAPIPKSSSQEMNHLVDSFDRMVERLHEVFQKLEGHAYVDALTGLPNQAALMMHLQAVISAASQTDQLLCAVLLVDLDAFKIIESGLGHFTADLLLKSVAVRLQECLETVEARGVTISRLERDEFGILINNIATEKVAIAAAETILQAFQEPFRLEEKDVFASASIGVVIVRGDCELPEVVLRDLNIATYKAKSLGKNRYVVFDSLMHLETTEKLQLETDLQYAIDRQELEIFYQPIITLNSNSIASVEALLRWRHPSGAFISPVKFIPIAEETGAITTIGEWILQTACHQMQIWHEKYPAWQEVCVSVNISAQQLLLPNFADTVEQLLQVTGLAGRYLQLEITESAAVSQPGSIETKLARLRSLGVKIWIDDFGTGYSHLNYLLQLPIDGIKIDRSFVREIGISSKGEEISKAILALATSLQLDAIAEGVETVEQLDYLQSLGCQKIQGFLFSTPLPSDRIIDFSPVLP
jgi:diguanylate cyclase (GGDEF)-like protein